MAKVSVPYFKWREGRPRWEPGPGVRRAGFKGQDLKDQHGRWLAKGPAIAAADVLNREVAAWKASGPAPIKPKPSAPHPRSVQALYADWLDSPKFGKKAATTQREYKMKAQRFLNEFGDVPVSVLAPGDLYSWWEHLHAKHGHAMANGILAVTRVMLSYARKKGWRKDNPAKQLELETVPPRLVLWTPSECVALVAAGDRLGLHEVGDAAVIALHTSQRLGDVLALEFQRTENGRSEFRQSKRGARVRVPHTDELARRLAEIRRRRTSGGTVDLERLNRVVLRADGGEHDPSSFNKAFRKVRAAIAAELPDVATKEFRDFRDTAITRLALADCNIAEIKSITGHKLATIHQVLEHYLVLDDRMAVAGIDKLKSWMAREGVAV